MNPDRVDQQGKILLRQITEETGIWYFIFDTAIQYYLIQIFLMLIHVYIKHTCPQNQSLLFQPLHHDGKDQRVVQGHAGTDVHKAGIGYKTISEKFGEKLTTAVNIIWK